MRKIFTFILLFTFALVQTQGAPKQISNDVKNKIVTISAGDMSLCIDYSKGCKISKAEIKADNKLAPEGSFTSIRVGNDLFTSADPMQDVKVVKSKDKVVISNIVYGNNALTVKETWIFTPSADGVNWKIVREYQKDATVEDISLPVWNFRDMSVWKGGILDNGGMVWCKYLNTNDTYGIHTGGATFWNPDNGHGLRVTPKSVGGLELAAKFTQTPNGKFAYNLYASDNELKQRHNLSRFVHGRADVFAPFAVKKGMQEIEMDIQAIDYLKEYSRGTLPGINANAVRELLNTTGRYGVVDRNIIGANGWTTNWKCLHEPFFAQIGLALQDPNYTNNLVSTLSQEREKAITPEGRVLSRWHDVGYDAIPGTYNDETGYYEAMWGYTVDSQTGYIINSAELFDLTGDVNWLKAQKVACEKVLDWLIRRDENNNGIFEMVNKNRNEDKCSDWSDVIWSSYENANVNAQMYEALKLWVDCEKVLGDTEKADYYSKVAARLKDAFNKDVDEGGFWMPEKTQYVYWRDNDGSVHGTNYFTPVNFSAIAFGICDDPKRKAAILDKFEELMRKENLFHWPLCFESFEKDEASGSQMPFPTYENGDIFPTWGYLGISSYVGHDKGLALKYVRNILDQYLIDGLSSQRYSRATQKGAGNDILAGICTTVTALYKDIYGVKPKWNRMGLEPNMTTELNGTDFNYALRGTDYRVRLSVDDYKLDCDDFSVQCNSAFGAQMNDGALCFFPANQEDMVLSVERNSSAPININVTKCGKDELKWSVDDKDKYNFKINKNLNGYKLTANGKPVVMTNESDAASFTFAVKKPVEFHLTRVK